MNRVYIPEDERLKRNEDPETSERPKKKAKIVNGRVQPPFKHHVFELCGVGLASSGSSRYHLRAKR